VQGAVLLTAVVTLRQLSAIRESAALAAEFEALASTDVLTGLRSRRNFFEAAEHYFTQTQQEQRPLTAIMIDIDHFKTINDTHGHAIGDQIIQTVAQTCAGQLRASDPIGRYGGDELVVLLPGAPPQRVHDIGQRLCQTVRDLHIPTPQGPVHVTLSVGVGDATGCQTLLELLERADRALYEAKDAGRDQARFLVTT
jgi:diguanylate cyclase (GGDEF)-like protein